MGCRVSSSDRPIREDIKRDDEERSCGPSRLNDMRGGKHFESTRGGRDDATLSGPRFVNSPTVAVIRTQTSGAYALHFTLPVAYFSLHQPAPVAQRCLRDPLFSRETLLFRFVLILCHHGDGG